MYILRTTCINKCGIIYTNLYLYIGAHWSRVEGPAPRGSILEPGKVGEFDHLFVAFPSVIETMNMYKMYYHTYDVKIKKYTLGLAVAMDGLLNWRKKGPVIPVYNNSIY